MSTEPDRKSFAGAKKRDVTAIKTTIVFFVGWRTALGRRIGRALARRRRWAPSLPLDVWLLQRKAQGSRCVRLLCHVCISSVWARHGMDPKLLAYGLAAFIGATVGALVVLPLAKTTRCATVVASFDIRDGGDGLGRLRYGAYWRYHVHTVAPVGLFAVAAIGMLVGALTQAGTLPAVSLWSLASTSPAISAPFQAITTSLLVIVLAALLPAWGYGQRGLVDTDYSGATITGGILGGIGGGIILLL